MATGLPWFPLYVDDLEGDAKYRALSYAGRGIYLTLLCWQWREGFIPSNVRELQRALLLSRKSDLYQLKKVVRTCFVPAGIDGQLANAKLAEVYVHQVDKSEKARRAALQRHSGRSADASNSQTGRNASKSKIEIQRKIKTSLTQAAENHPTPEV